MNVSKILKKRAIEAGFTNTYEFSSHSLRRGLATFASANGASLKSVMRQGRWRQISTVLGYIEEGQQFEDNAAQSILKKQS